MLLTGGSGILGDHSKHVVLALLNATLGTRPRDVSRHQVMSSGHHRLRGNVNEG